MAWISTTTLLARANFADAITSARGGAVNKGVGSGIDLNALLQGVTAATAADLVDQLAERLGPVPINDGSRAEILSDFSHYPIVQKYTSPELEKFFGVKGAKVVGFAKSGLAQSIYAEMKANRINSPKNSHEPPNPPSSPGPKVS